MLFADMFDFVSYSAITVTVRDCELLLASSTSEREPPPGLLEISDTSSSFQICHNVFLRTLRLRIFVRIYHEYGEEKKRKWEIM